MMLIAVDFLQYWNVLAQKTNRIIQGEMETTTSLCVCFFFFFSTLVELDFRIEDVATQAGRMAWCEALQMPAHLWETLVYFSK